MSRPVGSTSTVLLSVKDLQRVIKHFGPTHIPVGRGWFNSIVNEAEQPVVHLPRNLGAPIQNSKRR